MGGGGWLAKIVFSSQTGSLPFSNTLCRLYMQAICSNRTVNVMLGEEALLALKAGPSACGGEGGEGGGLLSNTQDVNISNNVCLVSSVSQDTALCH